VSFDIDQVDGTLKLYAALGLLLEAGLGTLVLLAPTAEVQQIAGIGMVAVFALMVVFAGMRWESTTRGTAVERQFRSAATGDDPLWGELDDAHVDAWVGVWRCEWSARTRSGDVVPYIDDTVTVSKVDPDTGDLTGRATGVYDKNFDGYALAGRVSTQWLAHLYYHFPPPHDEKVGMVILRIDPQADVAEGWWLGGGRGKGAPNVEGPVTWTKAEAFEGEWVDHAYELES
jgi:hypothetical protein